MEMVLAVCGVLPFKGIDLRKNASILLAREHLNVWDFLSSSRIHD